jgi:formamidopyrimidine-DNA glycosylase
VRKFGWIKLLQAAELVEYHSGLGLEPMQSSFSYNNFRKAMRLSRRPIKAALLDQSAIVGLGNIYVDESLFEAGILPQRPVDSLSELEWQALHKAIKKILKLAIKHRGTSFSDYRDAQGQRGNFADRLRVYGRGNQACLRCGTILLKQRLAGRGTHWCPNCQH